MSDTRVDAATAFCKLATEWRSNQLKRENDDLAFQVPELQWTAEARQRFDGGVINGIFSPPRPILSISKIDQPIQLVLNQERQAHLGVQVHPLSEDADKDTAERIQDIYRGIERDSFADLARTWAYERAVKAGMGFYRILTDFANEDMDGPGIHDQVIVIKRILDQRCVLLDPFATEPDWSDGQKALIYEMVPEDRYKKLYPDSALADFHDDGDFETVADGWWTGSEDEGRMIRVAEYFYIEHADEVKQVGDKSRTIKKPIVHWCKVNGVEVLEEAVLPGRYIPIVPVIGQELQLFDTERRFFGLISRAKDPQRLLNIEVSNAVNKDALATKIPWLLAEGQEEGHETEFELSTTRNLSMLRYKPTSLNGVPLPPPIRNLESPDLSSSLLLIQQANDYIQATTATYDPSLGKQARGNKPAKAIIAEQQQSEQGNSNYLDNLSRAMRHEARIVLGMLPTYYDRPGRRVRGVDGEDNEQEFIINAPFVKGKDGRPMPAQEGDPKAKTINLTSGVYGTSVSIGKSYRSRMEAGSEGLGQLLQAAPELMPILGPTWLQFQDFPGAEEAAKLLKKMQPPQLQQSEDEEPSPEELQAKLAQTTQMLEMAKQEMDAMRMALETKQVEQQGKIAAEQAKGATNAQIAEMEAKHEADKLLMQAAVDERLLKIEYMLKLKLQDDQQAHDAGMAAAGAGSTADEAQAGREHEASQAGEQRQHEANLGRQKADTEALKGQQGHAQTMRQGERSHQQSLEQGEAEHARGMESQTQAEQAAEKQAKLKPKPGEK